LIIYRMNRESMKDRKRYKNKVKRIWWLNKELLRTNWNVINRLWNNKRVFQNNIEIEKKLIIKEYQMEIK